ncbi:hypothetical protein HN371_28160 [Candidatus Poribacteria bacterium]|jgi:hypothetical protein|nr:hypothetical protein [Candidatus Poribacteria bacterium]MBT5535967.1 hypothetical protein [Candidatus Poribacteria bacterium]MBT5715007.1 hypothetical protein [Candidatus Poribacteria bacterium]MBT7101069.1 hypothetical protein [Candidatus Poribacteria bacterium]MBT7806383.1 hypothetical protein [Candidatus Poribacteria bacterium]
MPTRSRTIPQATPDSVPHAIFAWAQTLRTPAFARFGGVELAAHMRATEIRSGVGVDAYHRLFLDWQDPAARSDLLASDLPDDLRRKDSAYLVITTKCNNGMATADAEGQVAHKTCAHCLNGSGPNGVSMTFEEVERVVANLPYPLREIEISGGEVLHPDVMPLTLHTLRLCTERYGGDLLLSLQTNGDFLRNPRQCHDTLSLLRDAGLRRIVVASMDMYHAKGATPQDQFEERKRHYARVQENLRRDRVMFVTGDGAAWLPDDPSILTAHFFGADIDNRFDGFIIDDLVPNARAVRAGLVTEADNGVRYCSRHAGARGFLGGGAEDQVAINGGPVYPCCWFTEFPLGDAREMSVPHMLLGYVTDPLAIAQHLGVPERAWEIAQMISADLGAEMRDLQADLRPLNQCVACRRFTREYVALMQRHGYGAYDELWPDMPTPWSHASDPEHDLAFESWVAAS